MIVGLDLGTRRLGLVVAEPALPLRIARAETPMVNPHDLDATAREVRALVDTLAQCGPLPNVVIEFGDLYIPNDATPQQARAMAKNHALMGKLLDRIYEAIPGPIYRAETISRQAWAPRVVSRHKGGITDHQAAEGLATHLHNGTAPFETQDEIDAAGALVGWLLGPPKRKRRERTDGPPRPLLTPEQRAANRRKVVAACVAEISATRAATRLSLGCTCPTGHKGRHPSACPASPTPRLRGSAEAAAAYAPMTR